MKTTSSLSVLPVLVGLFVCLNLDVEAQSTDPNTVTWGGYVSQLVPTYVPPSLTNAIEVAVGEQESCALRSDGSVVRWPNFSEYNVIFMVTNGNEITAVTNDSEMLAGGAVRISSSDYRVLALMANGLVNEWFQGNSYPITVPESISNVVAISAGRYNNLALGVDGKVFSWSNGILITNVPTTLSNVVAISAGAWQNLALKSDGTVVAWGSTNLAPGLTNIIAIAAGNNHSLALRSNGRIVSWGDNTYGQRNGLTSLTNVVAISAGHLHSMALLNNGTVVVKGLTALTNIPVGLPFVTSLSSGLPTNMCAVVVDTGRAATPPVVLSTYPFAQTQRIGATAYIAAYTIGVNLHYQWYFGTNQLAGQTNSWLTLSDLHPSDSGDYWVVVSNEAGWVSSQVATLSVVLAADIQMTPTIIINGEVGSTVEVDYINSIGPTNDWRSLGSVVVTNNPQLYFDTSGVGKESRYYRLIQLP